MRHYIEFTKDEIEFSHKQIHVLIAHLHGDFEGLLEAMAEFSTYVDVSGKEKILSLLFTIHEKIVEAEKETQLTDLK